MSSSAKAARGHIIPVAVDAPTATKGLVRMSDRIRLRVEVFEALRLASTKVDGDEICVKGNVFVPDVERASAQLCNSIYIRSIETNALIVGEV